jgi:hypothetical protein
VNFLKMMAQVLGEKHLTTERKLIEVDDGVRRKL